MQYSTTKSAEKEQQYTRVFTPRQFQHPTVVLTTRRYASAVYAVVCPSVRPFVCPSQVDDILKRLNIGSRKQTPHDRNSRFLMPKISAKCKRGHPKRGR